MFDRFFRAVSRLHRLGFDRLRGFADRHAARRVLVLGDSHVRVFEHWLFLVAMPRTRFDVVHVPGGTALGILSPKSRSGARRRFDEALAMRRHDAVVVGLGEVDTDHAVWLSAARTGEPPEAVLDLALTRYFRYLDEVARREHLIVLGACLPTVETYPVDGDPVHKVRAATGATRRQRTDLALAFNARVAAWCAERGIVHLDSGPAALGPDGFVRPSWRRRDRLDHHYSRTRFAWWLVRRLRGVALSGAHSTA